MQFNGHLGFRVGFRDKFRDKVWDNFSTRKQKVWTCLETQKNIRDRFWDVPKMSIELHLSWLVPHGRPNTMAWRFIPSPTTRGLLRSTRTKSFRGDCKKKQGWKVSSGRHWQSMTLPSVIALPGMGGNGLDSEQVCLTNACTYETNSMTKVCFRPPQLKSNATIHQHNYL